MAVNNIQMWCALMAVKCSIIIIIIIYIAPSIDPLQGQRPTGCGSSQGTLSGYKE